MMVKSESFRKQVFFIYFIEVVAIFKCFISILFRYQVVKNYYQLPQIQAKNYVPYILHFGT